MKLLALPIVAGLLLSSCDDAEQQAETARLSAENVKLKAQAERLKGQLANAKKSAAEHEAQSLELASQLDLKAAQLDKLLNATKGLVAATEAKERLEDIQEQVRVQAVASAPQTDEQKLAAYVAGGIVGVPSDVSRAIIRKAQLERSAWSALYEIEQESKGYFASHEFGTKVTQMPTAVRDEILNSAKREHPSDWSRIADEVKEQSEAWTTMDEWKRVGAPGLTRAASAQAIAAAQQRYPNDWAMALFVLNDEVKRAGK